VVGNGRQREDVVYEGGGRVCQGSDGVVSVSWVLGLVWSGPPVEVEEEVGLGGDFPMCQQSGPVARDGGNGFGEACRGRVYLWRGADEP